MSKTVFLSLPALYGGPEQYLTTLNQMVRFISTTNNPNRGGFIDWASNEYPVTRTTVSNYLQALARLGIIEKHSNDDFYLSKFGQTFLRTTSIEAQSQLILKRLLSRYEAFHEMLMLFFKASEALNFEEITVILHAQFPQWNGSSPVVERIQWLLALDCISQLGSRRTYELSNFGRRMVSQVLSNTPTASNTVIEQDIIQNLYATARRIDQTNLFEQAVAKAFRYLGFDIQELGKRGETDLLAKPRLGPSSYSFVGLEDMKALPQKRC